MPAVWRRGQRNRPGPFCWLLRNRSYYDRTEITRNPADWVRHTWARTGADSGWQEMTYGTDSFPYLPYNDDLSIGAIGFHQAMGIGKLFKGEDLHWPRLIGSICHSINDLLHGNVGVRKVLRAKQQARKGIHIDAKRHVCQPIECDRLTASEKSCHTHAATFPGHVQRIKECAIADEVQDAINAIWIGSAYRLTELPVLKQDTRSTKLGEQRHLTFTPGRGENCHALFSGNIDSGLPQGGCSTAHKEYLARLHAQIGKETTPGRRIGFWNGCEVSPA